jgi:hypothetical protein
MTRQKSAQLDILQYLTGTHALRRAPKAVNYSKLSCAEIKGLKPF